VSVRLATASDVEPLVALRREFDEEDRPPTAAIDADFEGRCAAFYARAVASERWRVFVAEEDDVLVGHMCVGLVERVPRPIVQPHYWAYLTNVYVVPSWRDRGIGAALITAVQQWAREADLEPMVVWPSEASRDFYTRHDFAPSTDPMFWSA
jgi:GNAT superfamily N-acetyltransferase